MRLGIFGGSFDPVHFGHLLMAETCREQCQLDQIWFVPAAVAPHKPREAVASPQQRIEMLQLALAGHSAFSVSEIEIERGGVSYTVETLATLAARNPAATLFFLMGADSLSDLPGWREPDRICQLAIPLVVGRPGALPPDLSLLAQHVSPDRLNQIRQHVVEMPLMQLSSTDIRGRVREGHSIRYRTPRAVEQYILSNRLYQVDLASHA